MSPTDLSLQGFRAFFAGIPDSLWCVARLDGANGTHCARGHYGHGNDAEQRLDTLFEQLRATLPESVVTLSGATRYRTDDNLSLIGAVNNGIHPAYQQSTPRARILAALDDLIAMEAARHDAVETRPLVPVDANPLSNPAATLALVLI